MSRKGRRGRSNRPKPAVPKGAVERSSCVSPDEISPYERPGEGAVASLSRDDSPCGCPLEKGPSGDPADAQTAEEPSRLAGETLDPEEHTVPPVGDLDILFFDELPAESWLADELELRHPRVILKMTDTVARRRARLARYVAGVVVVSTALCVAALVKAVVPMSGEDGAPAYGERRAPASHAAVMERHVDPAPELDRADSRPDDGG